MKKAAPITRTLSYHDRGGLVWYNSPVDSWVPAQIITQKNDKLIVKLLDVNGNPINDEEIEVSSNDILNTDQESLPTEVDDMVSLTELNEPNILHNLKIRYNSDKIYTYVGPILVSVNPYKNVPIYGNDSIANYKGKPLHQMPPHIYALTDNAFRSMLHDKKNQSMLISGETGAGKTEATKYIMKYLAGITTTSGQYGAVEKQLLDSHPILEAFGNAKTGQNNNSSRFGKFFQIFFDASGSMIGATINHYLLEKSRVVIQGDSERNYHAFYQLLRGLEEDKKKSLWLGAPEDYEYLSRSGCTTIENVDDGSNFGVLRNSMKVLNIAESEQDTIFKLLSAVLNLGNLSFQKDTKRNEAALIGNKDVLDIVADLLGLLPSDLELALCNRNMSARVQSVYTIPLKVDEAISNRDALAKTIYGKIFDWLITRINTSLNNASGKTTGQKYFIGVLDIFGFEIFESNSFEQLMINYSNEQLQQYFNKHLIKVEQEEYVREKIDWAKIDFEDNTQVVELIEKKPLGLLSVLDEECNFPKGTDDTFLEKLSKQFKDHSCFKRPLRAPGMFVIKHYAGEVYYDTRGFLVKNKDTIHADLISAMLKSSDNFLKTLFTETETPATPSAKASGAPVKNSVLARAPGAVKASGGPAPGPSGAKKTTLGTQFKEQLKSLMNILSTTEPHFIRALKPNQDKRPNFLDAPNLLRQLRYSGLLETIRIRAAGFSHRPSYSDFAAKFKMLLDRNTANAAAKKPEREVVELILSQLQIDKRRIQMGITKLFLKNVDYDAMHDLREARLKNCANIIQRSWKFHYYSKRYRKVKSSVVALQNVIRMLNGRREFKKLQRDKEKQERENMLKKQKEEAERRDRELKEQQEKEAKLKKEQERKEREQKEKLEQQKLLEEQKKKEQAEKEKREKEQALHHQKVKEEQERREKENRERQLAEEARLKKEQQDREKEMEELKQIELKLQQEREEKEKAKQREAADIQAMYNHSEVQVFPIPADVKIVRGSESEKKPLPKPATPSGELVKEKPKKTQGNSTPAPAAPVPGSKITDDPIKARQLDMLNLISVPSHVPDVSDVALPPPLSESQKLEMLNSLPSVTQISQQSQQVAPGINPEIETRISGLEKQLAKTKDELESEKLERMVDQRTRQMEAEKFQKELERVEKSKTQEPQVPPFQAQPAPVQVLPPPDFAPQHPGAFVPMPAFAPGGVGAQPIPMFPVQGMAPSAPYFPSAPMEYSPEISHHKPLPQVPFAPIMSAEQPSYPNIANMMPKEEPKPIPKPVQESKVVESKPVQESKPVVMQEPEKVTTKAPEAAPLPKLNDSLYTRSVEKLPATNYGLNLYSTGEGLKTPNPLGLASSQNVNPRQSYMAAEIPVPQFGEISGNVPSYAPEQQQYVTPVTILPLQPGELPSAPPIGGKVYMPKPKQFVATVELKEEEESKGLQFQSIEKAPAMAIPKGEGLTKYDYSQSKSTPFQFEVEAEEKFAEQSEVIEVSEPFELVEEPEVGTEPESVNLQALEKTRGELPFTQYSPMFHKFSGEVPKRRELDDYKDSEMLIGYEKLGTGDASSVTYIKICDVTLNKKQLKQLPKQLNEYINCEVLILKNIDLKNNCEGLNLPKLRYVDFSQNNMAEATPIIDSISKSEWLNILVVQDNPVNWKPQVRERFIVGCPSLIRINDRDIDIDERLRAINAKGSKQQKKNIDYIHWDLVFSGLPLLQSMDNWSCGDITELNLSNCKLKTFHVGTLVNLKDLDLSSNNIETLLGGGLEQCTELVKLNLSFNRITNKKDFRVFEFTNSLLYLSMNGNRDDTKQLTEYRPYLIYVTRNLKGTNRSTGLIEIDGQPISLDERVSAVEEFSKKKSDGLLHRWQLSLMNYYGHHQIKTPNFLSRIRHCKASNANLSMVDLRGMFSLEVLDLSGNFLVKVDGLKELPKLRFLNLSGNLKLDLSDTLDQLKDSTELEQVSFGVNQDVKMTYFNQTYTEKHPLHVENPKYREKVLAALLLNNVRLKFVDNIYITVNERIDTMKHISAFNKDDIERYKFEIALVMNCVEPWERCYHYTEVGIGQQYDVLQVTALKKMTGFNLTSVSINFSQFENLEELNLSNNHLTDLSHLGLESLKHLRVLDVHHNDINTPIKELAAFFDRLKTLECLAVRENPVMKSDSDRKKLIGAMVTMREVTCVLQVIDTLVTIDERIEAWKNAGGNAAEAELMRYNAVLYQRLPRDLDANALTSLDLTDAGFEKIDVRKYPNLEILLLKNNKLANLEDTGIHSLKKLRVLNLQNNNLAKMEQVVEVVKSLPSLATVGLSGNKFAENKNWRVKFLSLMPELHQSHHTLRMIDETEISVDELVEAWKSFSKDSSAEASKNFRFQVLLLTKIPSDVESSQIEELDFSNCGLGFVDMSSYTKLIKLSLKNNDFKSLDDCRLSNLTGLKGLDLTNNKLKDIEHTAMALRELKSLTILFLDNNPCFPANDNENRVKFLTKYLQYFDPSSMPLKYLNGQKISVQEKCQALKKVKNFNANIETVRLELALKELNVKTGDTYLDLSNYEFGSIAGLHQHVPKLTHLNLSNNQLKNLEPEVFSNLPNLCHLDISNNNLQSLQQILNVLQHNKQLETLVLLNATKNKETALPREYAFKVCKALRQLTSVDGLKNPFGTIAPNRNKKKIQRIPTVMKLAEGLVASTEELLNANPNPSAEHLEDDGPLSNMYQQVQPTILTPDNTLYKPSVAPEDANVNQE